MRITESQLRKIVKKIIKENSQSGAGVPWVSMADVQSLLDNELLEALQDEVAASFKNRDYEGYTSTNPNNILNLIPDALADKERIMEAWEAFQIYNGFDPAAGDFILDLQNWITANRAEILKLIDENLDLTASDYEDDSMSDTERIFGSEAAYWRYRNG